MKVYRWDVGARQPLWRWLARLAGAALLVAALVALGRGVARVGHAAGASAGNDGPKLRVDESVGPDLEALARQTWADFSAVFSAQRDCYSDVQLRADRALDSRAAYDPTTATVTVRVPATAAMLQSGLLHEWAHHVEFQCAAHEGLRLPFLAAQGLPADAVWRPDVPPADIAAGEWAEIPSEQYAEAVIELVLGSRPVPTNVRLSRDAVRIVEAWVRGDGRPDCP